MMARGAINVEKLESDFKLRKILEEKKRNRFNLKGREFADELEHITILECLVGKYSNRSANARAMLISSSRKRLRERNRGE